MQPNFPAVQSKVGKKSHMSIRFLKNVYFLEVSIITYDLLQQKQHLSVKYRNNSVKTQIVSREYLKYTQMLEELPVNKISMFH